MTFVLPVDFTNIFLFSLRLTFRFQLAENHVLPVVTSVETRTNGETTATSTETADSRDDVTHDQATNTDTQLAVPTGGSMMDLPVVVTIDMLEDLLGVSWCGSFMPSWSFVERIKSFSRLFTTHPHCY